ncbi:hypothetical protein [Thalassobellus suaedae]|uniref:Right handed beta helix domain-containing protein n=1 Tax=Thalassobellus suaedae TaxID=3074124 RepID=A0ABY9Y6C0_9FLAO|nr:hypothetical protein RHP49_05045 [Flavobacteriaceae bacterium HL-DH10]
MKREFLLSIFLLFVVVYSTAQKSVALHSDGTTTIFGGDAPLIDAYDASITGDTLYVSGGNFVAPTTIDKGLVIIGAGYDTDSTAVTGKTYIYSSTINSGRIVIGSNASNLYMEGMQFQGGLVKSDADINGFTLIRLKIANLYFTNTGIVPTNASVIQCDILGDFHIQGVTYSVISNCILRGRILESNSNVFKNNVITYESGFGTLSNCDANTFMNNIFTTTNLLSDGNCSYNNFQYNIFAHPSPSLQTGATDLNNYKEVDMATVFVDMVASDFHLLPDASVTYLGDDGTEVGLYGGLLPFKEGAVPINPHVSFKSIQTTTDSNGVLNISFTVNAQQN